MDITIRNRKVYVSGCQKVSILVDGKLTDVISPTSRKLEIYCEKPGYTLKYSANIQKTTLPFTGVSGMNLFDYLERIPWVTTLEG